VSGPALAEELFKKPFKLEGGEFFTRHPAILWLSFPEAQTSIPQENDPLALQQIRVFVQVIEHAFGYLGDFKYQNESHYVSFGDFQAEAHIRISDRISNLYLVAEVYEIYNSLAWYQLENYGGGAGLRLDLHPSSRDKLSLAYLPLYGEDRILNGERWQRGLANSIIFQTSSEVTYVHHFESGIEPGARIYFQPSFEDVRFVRVLAEAFVHMKVYDLRPMHAHSFRVTEITIVPRVIYWNSTDPLDAAHQAKYGHVFTYLSKNAYAICGLEFRFAP
jgi:hypothetical protein